jgi:pyocin large subunit-like protein
VERLAREATWAPGQLQAHFDKHGQEGPSPSAEAYDASARETIRLGREFTYVDRTTNQRRRGFYEPQSNRFTAVTEDGRRITTHFRPDDSERYVRGLPGSTYR